ncbi:large subunit ribosomal protein L24 [Methylomagnum ishizawai]|uniref:Large ribosomal subunit protein uL24 n=1 Tax=Methylomagnum ishizawai TaxID=1760988 RepID=A0A1Y6DAT2_9GAMM|nr:50S ribosomal protein L24 [Methylomagnum ishizawai]SMF96765.1 large subunit ribosomal protein L24 [Methylomagnum ishizawai]
MQKIRKGDQVVVLTGKDKGKRGNVLSLPTDSYALVEGINTVRKHQKPLPMKGINGGIVEKTMPIHISNIALYNPSTHKADKIGFRLLADGRKVRYFKSTNETVDV